MTFDNLLGYILSNAYAKLYQNIPNGLRIIDIFHEQAGVKIFTNSRRQNQMFDYRVLYDIQLQVSVDFLRVVQLCLLFWCISALEDLHENLGREVCVRKPIEGQEV